MSPMRSRTMLLAALAVVASARVALADRTTASGAYAEIGLGAAGFLGAARDHGAVGPTAALRVGYDLLSFFSIGGRLELESHAATVPPPPEDQYFQLYHLGGDARVSARIGAIGLFADGGLGLSLVSTNVLAKVGVTDPDEHLTVSFAAGGGLEYQLMNRHYALGLAAQWSLYPGFDAAQAVAARTYLRYTY
jgi:hypothetical protein